MILELFAGAGCASIGIASVTDDASVGVEWDADACRTRSAAGLLTIRADIAAMDPSGFRCAVHGLWCSPPCPTFSAAGTGSGVALLDLLAQGVRDQLAGIDTRTDLRGPCWQIVVELVNAENAARVKRGKRSWTDTEVCDRADKRTDMSLLVLEPARFAHALRPSWVACEQVPAVLPLWEAMGHGLAVLGYGWWAGVLDAADYGVPQNRRRAILMARQGVSVSPPEPTHFDQRRQPSLFGQPHVSMADALGWGMTERPGITVAVGTGGGPDPQGAGGSGARRTVARARAGRVERERETTVATRGESGREQDEFSPMTPSRTITGKSDSWRRRGA